MIGLDTNILLRYLFNDDPKQSPIARRLIRSLQPAQPGWISAASMLEIAWMIKSRRHASRAEIALMLERLLVADNLVVEQGHILASAIDGFRSTRAEFADCFIAESAKAAGCNKVYTFDRIAARDAGMELVS